MQVLVRDNNVEQALRVLKKKMQREGVFREMKRRRFYEKPSERAAREKSEACAGSVRPLARRQFSMARCRLRARSQGTTPTAKPSPPSAPETTEPCGSLFSNRRQAPTCVPSRTIRKAISCRRNSGLGTRLASSVRRRHLPII